MHEIRPERLHLIDRNSWICGVACFLVAVENATPSCAGRIINVYAENLPQACPPENAAENAFELIYRLVERDPPTLQDFLSKAAQGKPCPATHDPCSWASCSFFTKMPEELIKLPRIRRRYGFVASVAVSGNLGRSVLGGTHVDLWRYAGVDLSRNVIAVEALA